MGAKEELARAANLELRAAKYRGWASRIRFLNLARSGHIQIGSMSTKEVVESLPRPETVPVFRYRGLSDREQVLIEKLKEKAAWLHDNAESIRTQAFGFTWRGGNCEVHDVASLLTYLRGIHHRLNGSANKRNYQTDLIARHMLDGAAEYAEALAKDGIENAVNTCRALGITIAYPDSSMPIERQINELIWKIEKLKGEIANTDTSGEKSTDREVNEVQVKQFILSLLTEGKSESHLNKMVSIAVSSEMTLDEKLAEVHKLWPNLHFCTDVQLGQMLGNVSKQAVNRSRWRKENPKPKNSSRISERTGRLKENRFNQQRDVDD